MTLRVLELNDAGLRLSDDSGVLLSSPGYALVLPRGIEFGERARGQSRVNPLHCFNQFWHKLSLDPFARPVGHFRHNADIAFSHLQDLAATAELAGDVLLAVPGSFSRQQLGILLGLLKQSPLKAVGIVDSALAAVLEQASPDNVIHADLHLHQVVLTRLQRQGDEIVRENVALVPGAGWVNLSDSLLQLFTAAFIQQCRFNPQHNAESEQKLLDGLPAWLLEDGEPEAGKPASAEEEARPSLLIRLEHNNTVHQARLARSSLHSRLQPLYQKIVQQIVALDPQGASTLLVSERLQSLPGFVDYLRAHVGDGVRGLGSHDENAIGRVCRQYGDALLSAPDAIQYITRLRVAGRPAHLATRHGHGPLPTHLLLGHQARRLREGLQICLASAGDGTLLLSRHDRRDPQVGACLGEITREDGHFAVHKADGLQINGTPVHGAHRLALGDKLSAAGSDTTLDVIRVQDGDE